MSDIALTSAMRRNLMSLQNTSKLMDMTSDRLSTGRKVTSALDNPSSYFTAKGLTNRAGDLSSLLDAMGQGLQTLKAAEQGIETVSDLVKQAKAVADEAFEAAAAADKGALFSVNDEAKTIAYTAAVVVGIGTLTFTNDDGETDVFSGTAASTFEEVADFVNNNVEGLSASFNATTGYMELTSSGGRSVRVAETSAFSQAGTTAIGAAIAANEYTDVASNTELMFQATTISVVITTDDGSKTFTGATGATVGDLVDWINEEVGDVTAKVGVNGLELSGKGGFTLEGLDQSVLDSADATAPGTIDGHYGGRTMTFGVKLEDTFTALANTDTMTFNGSAVAMSLITTGSDLLTKLNTLGDDWDAGVNSDGYVTLTYVGTETSPVEYNASSGTGSLFLNDSSLVTDQSFNGTFNVAGAVDNDLLVEQYNDLLTQITAAVGDADYKGINLLNGSDLTVNFNEDRTSSLTIEGVTFDAAGLGLATASGWKSTSDIQTALDDTDAATTTLRNQSAKFGREGAVIQTREEFTSNMINTLTEGADNLTLADMNEEGANMLALQTRQQLATSSLSMASQASQAVLSLFR